MFAKIARKKKISKEYDALWDVSPVRMTISNHTKMADWGKKPYTWTNCLKFPVFSRLISSIFISNFQQMMIISSRQGLVINPTRINGMEKTRKTTRSRCVDFRNFVIILQANFTIYFPWVEWIIRQMFSFYFKCSRITGMMMMKKEKTRKRPKQVSCFRSPCVTYRSRVDIFRETNNCTTKKCPIKPS